MGKDAYDKARKLALACYKSRTSRHEDPYLPVLDNLLKRSQIIKEGKKETREIFLDNVIGTKTQGRTEAFAANFMPLLESSSEFADKWMRLYHSQLEEGIRDAIKVYELGGRYYVQEGNKRVSVLKFCQASVILADVYEVIVDVQDTSDKGRIYREFLEFAHMTGLHDLLVSQPKSYRKLLTLLNPQNKESFSAQEKKDIASNYASFYQAYKKMPYDHLSLLPGDAYLLWLDTYGYHPESVLIPSALEKELEIMRQDLEMWPKKRKASLTSSTGSSDKSRIVDTLFRGVLKVAFIDSKDPDSSIWTLDHEKARKLLEKDMQGEIEIRVWNHADTPKQIQKAIEEAIAWKAEVIFTTNPAMLQASMKMAALHPEIKFVNCSLNLATGHLRTYFPRDFEVQFLMGLLAGILSGSDNIGYIASYPIYGTIANINAFAIGVQMTHQKARIWLDWSTTSQSTLVQYPEDVNILYIDGEKFSTDFVEDRKYGLFNTGEGRFYQLASETIHWEVFYRQILKSVINNSWRTDNLILDSDSINYWWGLSNGLLELNFSDTLPWPSRRLARLFKENLIRKEFYIFSGQLKDQDGQIRHDTEESMSLDALADMDWLNENIVGQIPVKKQMDSSTLPIVNQYGLDKVLEEAQDEETA